MISNRQLTVDRSGLLRSGSSLDHHSSSLVDHHSSAALLRQVPIGGAGSLHHQSSLHLPGTVSAALATGQDPASLLKNQRSPPLTLGRSLQLVTESRDQAASLATSLALAAAKDKKTVRFNSEDWSSLHHLQRPPFASNNSFSSYGRGSVPGAAAAYSTTAAAATSNPEFDSLLSCYGEDPDESWMTVEDVRSGRWARWEALRQV